MLLFCGVNNAGKSILMAFALLEKEDETCFDYAVDHFNKALASEQAPKVIILERNTQLKAALGKGLSSGTTLLFCNNHY